MAYDETVRIPADPEKRAALAKMAGLTDEETAALNQWCFDQEQERRRGVLLYEAEPASVVAWLLEDGTAVEAAEWDDREKFIASGARPLVVASVPVVDETATTVENCVAGKVPDCGDAECRFPCMTGTSRYDKEK